MKKVSSVLLSWYDDHARDLPWRVSPSDRAKGIKPDPYAVWMSEIMLQQTTVAAVKAYYNRFMMRWPTVEALAAAEDADVMAEWAGLGYYARARNLLKCARIVAEAGGFPADEPGLRKLPGIGPYTAAAIASISYDQPEPVMDGNVERVMARLYAVKEPLPGSKPHLYELAAKNTPKQRPGDYAQAVMDLGATICTPTSPSCLICPIREHCKAEKAGLAAELPRKAPKTEKPERYGHIYFVRRADGAVLVEERPAKGLLGGMLGFPGSDWAEVHPSEAPPLTARWDTSDTPVNHTFTHFKLSLTVHSAVVPANAQPERGTFVTGAKFNSRALPTVMRKVFDQASTSLESTQNA